MMESLRSDSLDVMPNIPSHLRRRGLGPFLAAGCGLLADGDDRCEAVVVLWAQALEVRSAVGPQVLPRSIVQRAQIRSDAQGAVLVVQTPSGTVRVWGDNLAPLAHRINAWLAPEGGCAFRPDEPMLGGGSAHFVDDKGRVDGVLMATPDGVVFAASSTATWHRFLWSELSAVRGRGLETLKGSCIGGDGVAAVLAARSASQGDARRMPRAIHLVTRATTGWAGGSVWLAVGTRGVVSRPIRAWARVFGSGTAQQWDWNAIQSIRSTGTRSGVAVEGPGGGRSWFGSGLRALAGELKRARWMAARSVLSSRSTNGNQIWEATVEARSDSEGAAWSWGRLRVAEGKVSFRLAGGQKDRFCVPLAELAWLPQQTGAFTTVGLRLPGGRWTVRPPDGTGFLRTFAALAGSPQPLFAASSTGRERRSGQRADVELPAWIDPWGRVPFLGPDRSIKVVEISASGLVFRTSFALHSGQKVGLAIRVGGPVEVARGTVVRELAPGTFAVRLESPPAALVQRLCRLVRQLERDAIVDIREDHVSLTAKG